MDQAAAGVRLVRCPPAHLLAQPVAPHQPAGREAGVKDVVRGVAQSGSAPALGAGGPGFESRRPDGVTPGPVTGSWLHGSPLRVRLAASVTMVVTKASLQGDRQGLRRAAQPGTRRPPTGGGPCQPERVRQQETDRDRDQTGIGTGIRRKRLHGRGPLRDRPVDSLRPAGQPSRVEYADSPPLQDSLSRPVPLITAPRLPNGLLSLLYGRAIHPGGAAPA